MQTLDKVFKETFIIDSNIETIEKEYTYHFKNVFKDVNAVLDFEKKLTKWESCDGAKPGFNTLKLPMWTSYYIAHQMLPDNISIINEEDIMNIRDSSLEFNYFYYNNTGWDKGNNSLVANNCLLPHTDPTYEHDTFIILFNLNQRPVKTCFWTFDNKRRVDSDEENKLLMDYTNSFTYDNFNHKMSEGRLKKQFCIEYGFNEAILYNANRLHSPVIDDYWTRENPRCMLRCMIRDYDYQ